MRLPRFGTFTAWGSDPLDPAEPGTNGRSFMLSWFGVVIEITISRAVP